MKEKRPLSVKYTQLQGPLYLKEEWYSGHTHFAGENIQGWTGDEHVVREKVLYKVNALEL